MSLPTQHNSMLETNICFQIKEQYKAEDSSAQGSATPYSDGGGQR